MTQRVPRTIFALLGWALLFLAVALVYVLSILDTIEESAPLSNLFVRQADAFVHGQLHVPHKCFDCASFQGKIFVPFPPAPAVLLTPFVAAFGSEGVNPPLIAALLSGITAIFAFGLFRRLALRTELSLWLTTAFILGTGYWSLVKGSDGVWFFAHICATFGLTFALWEAFGRARGWLVGIALAFAILSRQFTSIATIFFVVLLLDREARDRREKVWRLLGFTVPVLAAGCLYLLFNEARFGDPFDTGYAYLHRGSFVLKRFEKYGLFSWAYLPFNLTYLLLQGIHLEFTSPARLSGLNFDAFGTGLFQASPFLLLAFFASKSLRTGPCIAAWVAIGLMALCHCSYYLNGFSQTNTQRFSLDYLPLLFIFAALGFEREAARARVGLWKGAILYAILLNLLMVWAWEDVNSWLKVLG